MGFYPILQAEFIRIGFIIFIHPSIQRNNHEIHIADFGVILSRIFGKIVINFKNFFTCHCFLYPLFYFVIYIIPEFFILSRRIIIFLYIFYLSKFHMPLLPTLQKLPRSFFISPFLLYLYYIPIFYFVKIFSKIVTIFYNTQTKHKFKKPVYKLYIINYPLTI